MEILHVVSDKFKNFANNKNVSTSSQIASILRSGNIGDLKGRKLEPGQGLTDEFILSINQYFNSNKDKYDIDVSGFSALGVRASGFHTHKKSLDNSIITVPRKADNTTFISELVLHENSELMLDHQTGQHIQGIILVEAARQMFLAITEEYFIEKTDTKKRYFVINDIDTKYKSFVFPTKVSMQAKFVDINVENTERMKFKIKIEFVQGDTLATEIDVSYTVFLASKILSRESVLAAKHLEDGVKKNTTELSPC